MKTFFSQNILKGKNEYVFNVISTIYYPINITKNETINVGNITVVKQVGSYFMFQKIFTKEELFDQNPNIALVKFTQQTNGYTASVHAVPTNYEYTIELGF